jgi:hypothetical protein
MNKGNRAAYFLPIDFVYGSDDLHKLGNKRNILFNLSPFRAATLRWRLGPPNLATINSEIATGVADG